MVRITLEQVNNRLVEGAFQRKRPNVLDKSNVMAFSTVQEEYYPKKYV
jgi:hypothetical protein